MDDLISRQDAIDALNKEYHGMLSDESMKIYQIKDWLSALPSADITDTEECQKCQETTERVLLNKASAEADRPIGEWIDMSDGGRIKYIWYEKYMCDKCGERGTSAWSFCPNCGARMESGEE